MKLTMFDEVRLGETSFEAQKLDSHPEQRLGPRVWIVF